MKVAFFSETGNNQKYPRDFPNARTEVAWCLALDAPMCALDVLPDGHFVVVDGATVGAAVVIIVFTISFFFNLTNSSFE